MRGVKLEVAQAVAAFHEGLGYCLDLGRLTQARGLAVREWESGCAVHSVRRLIMLNRHLPPWKRRFNLAHEVVHDIINELGCAPALVLACGGDIEPFVNRLGSRLLMPDCELEQIHHMVGNSPAAIIELAHRTGASYESAIYRWVEHGSGPRGAVLAVKQQFGRVYKVRCHASRPNRWSWPAGHVIERREVTAERMLTHCVPRSKHLCVMVAA